VRIGKIRLILAAAVLAALTGWQAIHLFDDPYHVPTPRPGSLNDHDDDVPIITTLHEYALSHSDPDEVTGKSISFEFPRAIYSLSVNAQGGPQSRIGVSVDRATLGRINTAREIQELNISNVTKSNAYVLERLVARNLGAYIYTNRSNQYRGDYENIQEAIAERGVKPLAAFCGITWFRESDVDTFRRPGGNIASASPGSNFGYGADLIGYLDGPDVLPAQTAAFCNAELYYCEIYAPFEDWPMSFRLPRSELCEWQSELQRVRSFIAEHVVARTQRRSDEDQ
jgi:hypothetical protein